MASSAPAHPANPGNRGAHNRQVIARLDDATTIDAARAEMSGIAADLAREHPDNYPDGSGWGISVLSLRDLLVGDVRAPLELLLTAVGFVLVIATANVAGLYVVRATERRSELLTRAALGASGWRLGRQALIEGVLVGLAGAAVAVPLAAVCVGRIDALLPASVIRPASIVLDVRTLAFAIAGGSLVSCGAALIAALVGRPGRGCAPVEAGLRTTAGRSLRRARSSLVVAEVALACLLVVGAGLTITSFKRLSSVDAGLSTAHVTTGRVTPRGSDHAAVVRFYDEVLADLNGRPGIAAAGAVTRLPLGSDTEDYDFGVEGYVPDASGLDPNAQARTVGGRYFDALGIPILRGRAFDARDRPDADFVVIVSAALARQYWEGGEAVGRRVKIWGLDHPGPWRTVVGIAGDVRHRGLSEAARPTLYLPYTQWPESGLTVVVRGDGRDVPARTLEAAVRGADPGQPIYDLRDMQAWRDRSLASDRFTLLLMSAFGGTAVTLAALGIYGIMSFVVATRTREFGVRLALGAQPWRLVRLTLGEGVRLAGAGLVVGLALAAVAARALASLLYGVSAFEPIAYAGAAGVLSVVALVSCLIPARRANRVEAVEALRA